MGDETSVFVSYRRDDSKHAAGRLGERLHERFHLFMDIDNIRPGTDFTAVVRNAVDQADVVLAIIGTAWLRRPRSPAPAGSTTRTTGSPSRSARPCAAVRRSSRCSSTARGCPSAATSPRSSPTWPAGRRSPSTTSPSVRTAPGSSRSSRAWRASRRSRRSTSGRIPTTRRPVAPCSRGSGHVPPRGWSACCGAIPATSRSSTSWPRLAGARAWSSSTSGRGTRRWTGAGASPSRRWRGSRPSSPPRAWPSGSPRRNSR